MYTYVYYVYAWCMCRSEEDSRAHGSGVTDGFEPSWELKIELGSSARTSAADH